MSIYTKLQHGKSIKVYETSIVEFSIIGYFAALYIALYCLYKMIINAKWSCYCCEEYSGEDEEKRRVSRRNCKLLLSLLPKDIKNYKTSFDLQFLREEDVKLFLRRAITLQNFHLLDTPREKTQRILSDSSLYKRKQRTEKRNQNLLNESFIESDVFLSASDDNESIARNENSSDVTTIKSWRGQSLESSFSPSAEENMISPWLKPSKVSLKSGNLEKIRKIFVLFSKDNRDDISTESLRKTKERFFGDRSEHNKLAKLHSYSMLLEKRNLVINNKRKLENFNSNRRVKPEVKVILPVDSDNDFAQESLESIPDDVKQREEKVKSPKPRRIPCTKKKIDTMIPVGEDTRTTISEPELDNRDVEECLKISRIPIRKNINAEYSEKTKTIGVSILGIKRNAKTHSKQVVPSPKNTFRENQAIKLDAYEGSAGLFKKRSDLLLRTSKSQAIRKLPKSSYTNLNLSGEWIEKGTNSSDETRQKLIKAAKSRTENNFLKCKGYDRSESLANSDASNNIKKSIEPVECNEDIFSNLEILEEMSVSEDEEENLQFIQEEMLDLDRSSEEEDATNLKKINYSNKIMEPRIGSTDLNISLTAITSNESEDQKDAFDKPGKLIGSINSEGIFSNKTINIYHKSNTENVTVKMVPFEELQAKKDSGMNIQKIGLVNFNKETDGNVQISVKTLPMDAQSIRNNDWLLPDVHCGNETEYEKTRSFRPPKKNRRVSYKELVNTNFEKYRKLSLPSSNQNQTRYVYVPKLYTIQEERPRSRSPSSSRRTSVKRKH